MSSQTKRTEAFQVTGAVQACIINCFHCSRSVLCDDNLSRHSCISNSQIHAS